MQFLLTIVKLSLDMSPITLCHVNSHYIRWVVSIIATFFYK